MNEAKHRRVDSAEVCVGEGRWGVGQIAGDQRIMLLYRTAL